MDGGGADQAIRKNDRLVAEILQAVGRIWVGAQKTPVTGIAIVDQQSRIEIGQPGMQQVVGDRHIFFDIIEDQVAVCLRQVAPALASGQTAEQKTSICKEKSSRLCCRQNWRNRLAQVCTSS